MKTRRFRWWHGVAFYSGVQLAQWALRTVVEKKCDRRAGGAARELDRASYERQRLPVYAPPSIAFPIAWTINSVSLIAGGLHVLNLPEDTEGRAEFLRLQTFSWSLFALFDTAYFGLRSPINGALVTFAYSATTLASLAVALRRMEDRRTAFSLATTVAWLALANPVAVAQAAWNYDPFWHTGPFLMPPEGWEKSSRRSKDANSLRD